MGSRRAPGAFSNLSSGDRRDRIKVFRAEAVSASGAPGTVLDGEMTVACGHGAVRILEAQRSGRNVMTGAELIRGEPDLVGVVFAPPAEPAITPPA